MGEIIIRHTPADGTVIEGSRRGDGVWEILRDLRDRRQGNWHYSRDVGIYIRGSRGKLSDDHAAGQARAALEAAGHDVQVIADDTVRRDFAEAEKDSYDRAAARAARHGHLAGQAHASAAAAFAASDRLARSFPFGQPVLAGHYSAPRHRRMLERSHDLMRKSAAETRRGRYHEQRAQAADAHQAGRENPGVTLRRIERLAADEAKLTAAAGREPNERQAAQLALTRGELAYWRAHIARLEAEGVRVWGPGDFAKGDFALHRGQWFEVTRVNAKTLTVPWYVEFATMPVITAEFARQYAGRRNLGRMPTGTLPYSEIGGHRDAAQVQASAAEGGDGS